jgi:hypothetical protein
VHTINEEHAAVAHLCVLADPIGMLRAAMSEAVGSDVESVIVFGSIARGRRPGAATSTWRSSHVPGDRARAFLRKAEEYLASAQANLVAERHAAAAGDAIHAGISAKDAIVTALTGATREAKDRAASAKELKVALGKRSEAAAAEKALRELTSPKGEVESGTALLTATKAEPLVRRARLMVELAARIVRLGG